jgi:hypothetical protein
MTAFSYLSKYGQYDFVSMTRCPSKFIDVVMWEHLLLGSQIFGRGKFATLTPLSLLILCKIAFPVVGLEIFSLPTFALESLNRIFMRYMEN